MLIKEGRKNTSPDDAGRNGRVLNYLLAEVNSIKCENRNKFVKLEENNRNLLSKINTLETKVTRLETSPDKMMNNTFLSQTNGTWLPYLAQEKYNSTDKLNNTIGNFSLEKSSALFQKEAYKEIIYPDTTTYKGMIKNNSRHGEGVLNTDLTKYQGKWINNSRNGHGEETDVLGNRYKGEWLNDKMHGYGEEYYIDGEIYKGMWKTGKRHGKGEYKYRDGEIFKGEFKDNKPYGYGLKTDIHGIVLKGFFKDYHLNGHGEQFFTNNEIYRGQFVNSLKHGKGELIKPNGDIIHGKWKNDNYVSFPTGTQLNLAKK